MDAHQSRNRAIEEEAQILAEFIREQARFIDEVLGYAREARAHAQAALECSRRVRAEIAARRARFGRPSP